MSGGFAAKDIPDVEMLQAVENARLAFGGAWAVRNRDLDPKHFPDIPMKVCQAKRRQLIKRGLMDGCTCGCRGDFTLTDKGREYLAAANPENGGEDG